MTTAADGGGGRATRRQPSTNRTLRRDELCGAVLPALRARLAKRSRRSALALRRFHRRFCRRPSMAARTPTPPQLPQVPCAAASALRAAPKRQRGKPPQPPAGCRASRRKARSVAADTPRLVAPVAGWRRCCCGCGGAVSLALRTRRCGQAGRHCRSPLRVRSVRWLSVLHWRSLLICARIRVAGGLPSRLAESLRTRWRHRYYLCERAAARTARKYLGARLPQTVGDDEGLRRLGRALVAVLSQHT
jgi:hypothetical protein